MDRKRPNKKRKLRIAIYCYVVLVLLILTTTATYTWFNLSRTPKVSDMALYVNTPTGLELSADPQNGEWVMQLDFAELVGESAPLRPITWSDADQRFYAAIYGFDGRLTGDYEPLSDAENANQDSLYGYYIKGVFYARTGEDVSVKLSPAVEVADGLQGSGTYLIGAPVWNGQRVLHDNGGSGAELAMRIGFLIQKTDLNGVDTDEPPEFYIYEPNYDEHVDGSRGFAETPSIDGSSGLVPSDRLILQTTSTWWEAYPVERDVLIRSMGEFTTDATLFDLGTDELARITVYIWLEGQDVDCTNVIGHEAQIFASIQFATDPDDHGGLQPIPDE